MGGIAADLIFTDPPYMVDYRSVGGLSYDSKKFGNGGAIFNDDLDEEAAQQFFVDVLTNLYAVSSKRAPIYWWLAMRNWHINHAAFLQTGWHPSQTIIWLKESMVYSMGQDFHRVYEPCLFGWKAGQSHFKNKRLANYKNVFSLEREDFEALLDVWYERRDRTTEYVHPTQKPTGLCKRALKKHTRADDAVLDLFGGSGSTLVACADMGRKAFLMELDPKYCDAIRKRWADKIGKGEQWQAATPAVK